MYLTFHYNTGDKRGGLHANNFITQWEGDIPPLRRASHHPPLQRPNVTTQL